MASKTNQISSHVAYLASFSKFYPSELLTTQIRFHLSEVRSVKGVIESTQLTEVAMFNLTMQNCASVMFIGVRKANIKFFCDVLYFTV